MRFLFILLIAIFIPLSAFAQTEADFWQAVRMEWGAYATKENVMLEKGDVTCDGVPDMVGSRVNLDNPDGPFFDLLVLTRYKDEFRTELMTLPFTGSYEQYGLCGDPEKNPRPEVIIEIWSSEETEEMLGQPACTQAIAVVDGLCDSPRFFWNSEEENIAHFIFFRH